MEILQEKGQKKVKVYDLEELRKKYPKAYMPWTKEEDTLLIKLYDKYIGGTSKNFEEFLEYTSKQFGRRSNGIRGHLAKFYENIPGWDYESAKKRAEERKKKKVEELENIIISENPEPLPQLDISGNLEAQKALDLMEQTGQNLFLTGEAGTGKSTLLQYFRKTTSKDVVVLAPTGVAALNIEGQTIHSFCSFGIDITPAKVKKLAPWSPKRKLLQKLHTIVIDEISMVRADLLDCVDKFLRVNGPVPTLPFGGIQMVLIGDLHQLPPVEKDFAAGDGLIKEYQSPYFFDSHVFRQSQFVFIALKKIYRQKDQLFIELLNAVRNNSATEDHLTLLNRRCVSEDNTFIFEKFAIYLTTTNSRASQVNNWFLNRLSTELKKYQGSALGDFEARELPTENILQIKVGAQVMMLNNDQKSRWVNGTMGKILQIQKSEEEGRSDAIVVELENGNVEQVFPHTWEMLRFTYSTVRKQIETKTTGTFTQYPLKLAWAVTIHKSQGKTFDKVYLDLSTGTFAHGQLYVALSRCRTLEGITLKYPIEQSHILMDERVIKFLAEFENNIQLQK